MLDILGFAKTIGKSKRIARTGWKREGVYDPESVAEHCFRLAVLSMVLGPILSVDSQKLVKMAILHDLGEVKTGDTVVERWGKVDKKARKEKDIKEKETIDQIFKDTKEHKEYLEIFQEMVEIKTSESQIFKQLDKLEMAIQALEYEEEQGKNLEEFFVDAAANIYHPTLKKVMNRVLTERKK